MVIVEGVRQNWQPRPVEIIKENVPFLRNRFDSEMNLASAFIVGNVNYSWKKGRIDTWK